MVDQVGEIEASGRAFQQADLDVVQVLRRTDVGVLAHDQLVEAEIDAVDAEHDHRDGVVDHRDRRQVAGPPQVDLAGHQRLAGERAGGEDPGGDLLEARESALLDRDDVHGKRQIEPET